MRNCMDKNNYSYWHNAQMEEIALMQLLVLYRVWEDYRVAEINMWKIAALVP